MFAGNLQDFKEWEKGADLQQKPNNFKLEKCYEKCANMIFKPGGSEEVVKKCHEECKSSLSKLILNDLNDRLIGIKNDVHEASDLLSTALSQDINQDLMYF